jgi:hypothetical protein
MLVFDLFIELSGHGFQATTAANLTSDDSFFQSNEFLQSRNTVYSPPNRYVTQKRSANGKHIVFAGHDIGVFYNWYVDHRYLMILNNRHYRAACSAATNGFSNKVYKGFSTYAEAHRVWHTFVDHGTLPSDVLNTLNGRPYPLPPTMPPPDIGGLADPPTLTPLQAPAATGRPIATPFVHHPEAFGMPSASRMRSRAPDGLTLRLETTFSAATLSASAAVPKPATQKPNAQAGSSHKQRASDAEDFWVVLTGASPGVYQGR